MALCWMECVLFISSGCTPLTRPYLANDVMTYANLIYLGTLTDRVTILPMFTPSHIGGDAAPIPFGEVFDVPRFIQESGIQVVEWDEVKDPQSDVVDDLGCWNIWEAVQYREHHPRSSAAPEHLKLGTRLPLSFISVLPDRSNRCLLHKSPRLGQARSKL